MAAILGPTTITQDLELQQMADSVFLAEMFYLLRNGN
jgi:hypothetical protein